MTFKEAKQTVKDALQGKDFDESYLVKVLNIAKKVYYNSGDKLPESVVTWFEDKVTDAVFDKLEDILRETNPKSSYFKNNVGAKVSETSKSKSNASMRKTKLPVPMMSLDKIKPDSKELLPFIKQGPFVISAKVDGVSLLILTKTKKLFTRGNGTVGQDISYLWNSLSLPANPKGDYIIRGEMVIPKEVFEAHKKEFGKKGNDAKNARNSMSGLVNSGEASSLFKHVKVLTYTVVGKKPSEAFPLMEKLGFETPFWLKVPSLTINKLDEYLRRVKSLSYEADGLVVAKDVVESPKESNPEHTVAYKNNAIADKKVFKVKEVIWQPSMHGKLKPVLSLVPQTLDGVTISKCTAFNGEFIEKNKLGPGAEIKLVRSGGVIPHVLEVVKPASKAQMPEDYVWRGVDIYVPDKESNSEVAIKKIAYFFKYLGAEGVSQKTFELLYNEGYDSLKAILSISKNQLLALPGVQNKSATLIYNQIQKTKSATLADYMTASGCFPSTIASVRISSVLNKFPNILELPKANIFERVSTLSGFSSITARDFASGAEKFKAWRKSLGSLITIEQPAKKQIRSDKFKGMIVCPTGFRFDKETKDYIEENGGKVQTSMTKETTIVVTKDASSSSTKVQKAKEKGIKVIPLVTFNKLIEK